MDKHSLSTQTEITEKSGPYVIVTCDSKATSVDDAVGAVLFAMFSFGAGDYVLQHGARTLSVSTPLIELEGNPPNLIAVPQKERSCRTGSNQRATSADFAHI